MALEQVTMNTPFAHRPSLFVLFLVCGISLPSLSGLSIFPFSMIPSEIYWAYRISLSLLFLVISLTSYRRKSFKRYWKVFISFFIASFALNIQAISGSFVFQSSPINNIVLAMLSSTALVVVPIILISRVSGDSLGSIFLAKGNLKRGVLVGSIGFVGFALVAVPAATFLFQGQNVTAARAIGWSWPLLLTVFANGFREELLYRGLFLKKFEPLLGTKSSNILQAIIFSLSHTVAGRGSMSYTPYILVLVIFTFILGLVWGLVMQKTNSLLGSVLFHAGSDLSVFLGIFSNLP